MKNALHSVQKRFPMPNCWLVILRTGVSGMNSIELAQHIFFCVLQVKGLTGAFIHHDS